VPHHDEREQRQQRATDVAHPVKLRALHERRLRARLRRGLAELTLLPVRLLALTILALLVLAELPGLPRVSALTLRLAQLAAGGQTITYGQLARELELTGPSTIARLTAALEATMEEDVAQNHPFRAVVLSGRLAKDLPASSNKTLKHSKTWKTI
jgi:hypothetical protein